MRDHSMALDWPNARPDGPGVQRVRAGRPGAGVTAAVRHAGWCAHGQAHIRASDLGLATSLSRLGPPVGSRIMTRMARR